MFPIPPGKFLKILEFSLFSGHQKFWKSMQVLESSGNLMSGPRKGLEFAPFHISHYCFTLSRCSVKEYYLQLLLMK